MNENTETFRHFAFVVNGVVEEVMSINSGQDWNKFIELYASRPVIIEVPDSLNDFGKGYTWDGENFAPPV
jgi:hypothetical protein